YSVTLVRKAAMVVGFGIPAIAVIGCALAGTSYLWWLMAAGVGCGVTGAGIYAFCQTMAGPHAVGRWYGPQNGFANFAGVIGPALTGWVVNRTGNFILPFAITSIVCAIGVIAWVFIVGRVEQIDWSARRSALPASAKA
ncbi:MAG TPA: MFS transporter, partial [Terriglobales bacterium]|nr:MFS transporter [Terriglobales bacterium]